MPEDKLIKVPLLKKTIYPSSIKNENENFHPKYLKKINELNFYSQLQRSDLNDFIHFTSNLKYLVFNSGIDSSETIRELSQLNFKKLWYLKLAGYQFKSIDFFKGFESLNRLHIVTQKSSVFAKELDLDSVFIQSDNKLKTIDFSKANIKNIEIECPSNEKLSLKASYSTSFIKILCEIFDIHSIQETKNLALLEISSQLVDSKTHPNQCIAALPSLRVNSVNSLANFRLEKHFLKLETLSFNATTDLDAIELILRNTNLQNLDLGLCDLKQDIINLQTKFPNIKIKARTNPIDTRGECYQIFIDGSWL